MSGQQIDGDEIGTLGRSGKINGVTIGCLGRLPNYRRWNMRGYTAVHGRTEIINNIEGDISEKNKVEGDIID